MTIEDKLTEFRNIINENDNIVFFTGAGVSTDSGIPDFRSQDGLYHQNYSYPPEEIISAHFFHQNPEEFYRFYKEKMLYLDAEPNDTHKYMADLEKTHRSVSVVTQNIDGLHQKAGSHRVYELHGSVLRNYCTHCGRSYTAEHIKSSAGIPYCSCGGIIKPDVVLYEESLSDPVVRGAVDAISRAEVMVVLGTSLVVYPAAGLLRYFNGKKLVLINRSVTQYDNQADLLIQASFADIFPELRRTSQQ